ncbi:SNF2 family N-terminal domain-containing protein [Tricladium varicosporioides]|nr:SNF2 family N-terminal domain-containing protein [Hymenoscyphus varicosporioides]
MASSVASPSARSETPGSRHPTTAPSSPPEYTPSEDMNPDYATKEELEMMEEEKRIAAEQQKEEKKREKKRQAALNKEKNKTKEERDAQREELNLLLDQSKLFSNVLTNKTQVLGRVGSGMDGTSLGEHSLTMAEQPKCMRGGTMRPYQLEGLTWMMEVVSQGMSGILADEMGLGKTIQTIGLISYLREKEDYLGPHLIIAPLSTLSNWIEEFEKWVPGLPVVLYHGTIAHRREIFKKQIMRYYENGRPTKKFPVVLTSPEITIKDETFLTKIGWEIIIVDEGHRLKNSETTLFRILKTFTSATRLLITGTPLQNNLKELWSLLNFLLPNIFRNWAQFESWFDFSDLENEEGTEQFIQDKMKHELVKKMHVVLQPLLLRRIKADVEHMLPKKREYILYAPMTREQSDLYHAITDKKVDTRKFLEEKVVERLTSATNTPAGSRKPSPKYDTRVETKVAKDEDSSDDDQPLALRPRIGKSTKTAAPKNAFEQMMQKKVEPKGRGRPKKSLKRKSTEELIVPVVKSAKSSRNSTPGSVRSRSTRNRKVYTETLDSEDDALSDDEFEQKLVEEIQGKSQADESEADPEEARIAKTLELAKKEISVKKLGNPLMQLRLTCNSPFNFYQPWSQDHPVDESIVRTSGKMMLLDRLLKSLFERGHKVLIFSQFQTQLDILEDYARELRNWNVCRIDGSVAQDDRRQQIKEFNTNPEFKLFLLSTRAGGQGINLASADTVILFDSDWNPQQDLQAQDRAHRIGQTKPVIIFRLATKGTVEEALLKSADAKRRLEKTVIKKGGFKNMGQKMDLGEDLDANELKQLLWKDGQVFKYNGDKEQILSDGDLDILLDRSDEAYEKAAEGLGNLAGAYQVVETKVEGLMETMAQKKE